MIFRNIDDTMTGTNDQGKQSKIMDKFGSVQQHSNKPHNNTNDNKFVYLEELLDKTFIDEYFR
jgi:hypothetical protein